MTPAGTLSMIAALAVIADSGMPPAMDLAVVTMSGAQPASAQYSEAKYFPVRQLPHCTSSAMSRIPLSSQILRTAFTHSMGAGMKPPSPCRGSTIMQAISLAGAPSSKTRFSSSM